MRPTAIIILIALFSLVFSSCKVWNPNQIFRTGKSYDYTELSPYSAQEYKITAGDRLEMAVFSNDGYKLLDAGLAGGITTVQSPGKLLSYLVDQKGVARFPMIDTVTMSGLSVFEASRKLEDRYKKHLTDPFVQLNVINRRVFVYRGNDEAAVVSLDNENMTLMEVLAEAGGLPATGKAYKVKLVRGEPDNPKISLIDLRDPDKVKQANIIVQANDVLIVDPTFETTLFEQLAPIFTFVTGVVAIYALFANLNAK